MYIITDYVKHLRTSTSRLYGIDVSNGPYDMTEKRRGYLIYHMAIIHI